MPKKGNGTVHLKPYKSYRFTRRDPEMDRLQDLVLQNNFSKAELSRGSGVSTSTFSAWWKRRTTCRPQNASIEATGRSMGYERVWKRMKDKEAAR